MDFLQLQSVHSRSTPRYQAERGSRYRKCGYWYNKVSMMILFRVSNVTSGRDKVHYITSDVSLEFRLAVNIDKSNHTMSYQTHPSNLVSWWLRKSYEFRVFWYFRRSEHQWQYHVNMPFKRRRWTVWYGMVSKVWYGPKLHEIRIFWTIIIIKKAWAKHQYKASEKNNLLYFFSTSV